MDDLTDDEEPREIHETAARLWLVEFLGGPLDGYVEVKEQKLYRTVERRWYSFVRDGKDPSIPSYTYRLVEPIGKGHVFMHYVEEIRRLPDEHDDL